VRLARATNPSQIAQLVAEPVKDEQTSSGEHIQNDSRKFLIVFRLLEVPNDPWTALDLCKVAIKLILFKLSFVFRADIVHKFSLTFLTPFSNK
jgi:hypothetical protein